MSFFKSETKVKDLRSPERKRADAFIEGLYKTEAPQYPVAPVAGLSPLEERAQQMALDYAGSTPEGADYLKSVVGGSDNIMEDPAYKALLDQVYEKGSLETNRLGRSLQLRGGATSSTGRDMLGRSVEDIQSNALATLAPYVEAGKNRKMTAAGALNSLGENSTLNRLNALSVQGALQRNLEQLQKTAEYEREMRMLNFPYEVQAQLALGLAGLPSEQAIIQKPSTFSQIAPILGQVPQMVNAAGAVKNLFGGTGAAAAQYSGVQSTPFNTMNA